MEDERDLTIAFGPVGLAGWGLLLLGILTRKRFLSLLGLAGVVADATVAELGGFKAMNESRPTPSEPEGDVLRVWIGPRDLHAVGLHIRVADDDLDPGHFDVDGIVGLQCEPCGSGPRGLLDRIVESLRVVLVAKLRYPFKSADRPASTISLGDRHVVLLGRGSPPGRPYCPRAPDSTRRGVRRLWPATVPLARGSRQSVGGTFVMTAL